MLCEDVIVIGSGAAEKMTWLDAYDLGTSVSQKSPDHHGRRRFADQAPQKWPKVPTRPISSLDATGDQPESRTRTEK